MLQIFKATAQAFGVRYSTSARQITDLLTNYETETKVLKVAVIGMPNVGKSTFINNLMDRKVCPASSKVHTTRTKSRAIFTEGDSQIIFLDTPGVVSIKEQKKFNLEKTFLKDGKACLQDADIIGVIHDAANVWTRDKIDIKVLTLLENNMDKPSFLIFNKVDILTTKRKLLDLTRVVTENRIGGQLIPGSKPLQKNSDIKGWPYFQEIFMISALTGSGIPEVKNYLIKVAKPGKWVYPADVWSDKEAEKIINDSVKAKLLDFLPQEIPYQLSPELEFFSVNEKGIISTVVLIQCPSQRIAKLVGGVGDGKLRQITESLQHDLQYTFQNYVRIKLVLQAPKENN